MGPPLQILHEAKHLYYVGGHEDFNVDPGDADRGHGHAAIDPLQIH